MFTVLDFIAKAIELSDKCQLRANRDPKPGQKDSALHTSDGWNKTKKGNSSKKTLSASIVRRKGTLPVTAEAPEEPNKGNRLLKDAHPGRTMAPPMLPLAYRMAPGPQ